jgi:Superinfection immunity protein
MGTIVVVLVVAYFIPAVVALLRSHRQKGAIIALNILLGWTFVGWVAALVWSFTNPTPVVVVHESSLRQ